MSTLFLKIFNMSITAGWLILAVIVLRLMLQKAPKWISCLLWAFVAIRLLCPVTIESTLSLLPSAEPIKEANLTSQEAVLDSGITFVNHMVNPVVENALAATPAANSNPLDIWLFLGSIIWIVGIFAMFGYAAISYLRFHEKVAASILLQDNVKICDAIQTSFILGIIKPIIFVPSDINEQQMKHILAHEEAHIRRHDHWWKPLGFLILSVYWFHPLCWAAYILFCRDMELACDEKVIHDYTLDEKKAYSDTLLDCSICQKNFTVCPLTFGEIGVRKRIRAVLNYKRPAFWVILLAVAACIVAAVCFLTNPPQPDADILPQKKISENSPQNEPVNQPKEPEKTGITLELVKMEANCPYYNLTLQKIDHPSGEVIPFEKDNVENNVESLRSIWYNFDNINVFRTLNYSFVNLDGEDSVTITADGLDCTVNLPVEEYREITLNQKIDFVKEEAPNARLSSARIYPNALVLYCEQGNAVQAEKLFYTFDLVRKAFYGNSESIEPLKTQQFTAFLDDERIAYGFHFPDGFPTDETLYFRVLKNERQADNSLVQTYEDYKLNLD